MSLTLLGWRRDVASLYAAVRASQDPRGAHALWRRGRDALMASHPDSPVPPAARPALRGLPYAPYDPALRWTLPLLPADPEDLDVPTGTDGVVGFRRIGRLELPDGRGSLDVWWLRQYAGGLFVPLRDATAGRTTYGGGRYLLDTAKGADLGGDDTHLVVDLNFAYQPSCAYDPAWACPLAPPGNVLTVPVEAGELYDPSAYGA
ncbi:MAG: DUF1684 domain-containing protein [Frankiales bacterium]|nr:DUF1684 domain-containing protein [Frankiales bacterium]